MGIATSLRRRRFPARPRSGSTRRWRQSRILVFQRDGHRCVHCGGYGNDIGHVVPRAMGGTDHVSNLRVECASCNRSDGARLGNRLQRIIPGAITLEE